MSDPVHVLTPAYYERLAALETRHWWWRGMRGIAEALLDPIASASPFDRAQGRHDWRVVDAGCGTGLMLSWVARYTRVEPIGLDRAADGLRFCRARGHRRLLQGDAIALPLASGSFDLALSLDVIQHLPRPGGDLAAIRELSRALVPGGHLLLRTNSRCGYPPDRAYDYHRYSLDEVHALLDAAGFDRVALSYINVVPAVALTIRRRLGLHGAAASDPGLPSPPDRIDRSLRARVGSTLLGAEAWYLRRARRGLPYGHSIIALGRKRA